MCRRHACARERTRELIGPVFTVRPLERVAWAKEVDRAEEANEHPLGLALDAVVARVVRAVGGLVGDSQPDLVARVEGGAHPTEKDVFVAGLRRGGVWSGGEVTREGRRPRGARRARGKGARAGLWLFAERIPVDTNRAARIHVRDTRTSPALPA